MWWKPASAALLWLERNAGKPLAWMHIYVVDKFAKLYQPPKPCEVEALLESSTKYDGNVSWHEHVSANKKELLNDISHCYRERDQREGNNESLDEFAWLDFGPLLIGPSVVRELRDAFDLEEQHALLSASGTPFQSLKDKINQLSHSVERIAAGVEPSKSERNLVSELNTELTKLDQYRVEPPRNMSLLYGKVQTLAVALKEVEQRKQNMTSIWKEWEGISRIELERAGEDRIEYESIMFDISSALAVVLYSYIAGLFWTLTLFPRFREARFCLLSSVGLGAFLELLRIMRALGEEIEGSRLVFPLWFCSSVMLMLHLWRNGRM